MTTVFDVLRVLMENGWRLAFHFGNHREFRHHAKPGLKMIVRGKPADEVLPEYYAAFLFDAGIGSDAEGETR